MSLPMKDASCTNATTGGLAVTYSPTVEEVDNGQVLVPVSLSGFFNVGERFTILHRPSKGQNDGSKSKKKVKMTLAAPEILASGETVYHVARVEFESHPDSAITDLDDKLRNIAAQMCINTGLDPFIEHGVGIT